MRSLALTVTILLAAACGDDDGHDHIDAGTTPDGATPPFAERVYVAHEGSLVSYDVATGAEQPGALQNVTGPVDMQALADGTIGVNLTGRNEVLFVDGTTMLETARVATSATTATRPVHSYLPPTFGGKTYWVAMNDGDGMLPTNSAAFIDIAAGSATRFTRVGEVALGVGHHKAAFSKTQERVAISSIGDCNNVISVYDYSDIGNITTLATLTGAQAGFGAPDPGMGGFDPKFCDPTYARGLPPAPHGCATSSLSGKAYCNITSSGAIVVIDLDATTPTFTLLPTTGGGGGKTHMHPGGRYAYSLQEDPRGMCQIGQVVVIDTMTDTIAKEVPLQYLGPSCAMDLAGTLAESANPDHLYFVGDTLFVGVAGGFGVDTARVDQLVVLDTTDPASPVQQASIAVGVTTSHSSAALSGDGKFLFTINGIDGTVTQVDTATKTVVKTITVEAMPKTNATFGAAEGPSEQTGPID